MKHITLLFTLLLLIPSCGQDKSAGSGRIIVAVSIHPLYDVVSQVCGDRCEVIRTVDPGADPHSFEPAPSIAVKISRADICVIINPNFDGWMKKFIGTGTEIIYLTGGKDSAEMNPHVWLYPPDMTGYMRSVSSSLIMKSPKDKKYFEERLAVFTSEMNGLDKKIRNIFSGIENKKAIQWHPAWDRFAEGYGIEIAATVETGHGGQASIKRIASSAEIARRKGIRAVILNRRAPSSAADSLIKSIGGVPAMMDQIGGYGERAAYSGLMLYNAETLAGALSPAKQRGK